MKHVLARFAADRSGATAVEYGLIAGVIAVVLCGVLMLFSDPINTQMQTITDAVD